LPEYIKVIGWGGNLTPEVFGESKRGAVYMSGVGSLKRRKDATVNMRVADALRDKDQNQTQNIHNGGRKGNKRRERGPKLKLV